MDIVNFLPLYKRLGIVTPARQHKPNLSSNHEPHIPLSVQRRACDSGREAVKHKTGHYTFLKPKPHFPPLFFYIYFKNSIAVSLSIETGSTPDLVCHKS